MAKFQRALFFCAFTGCLPYPPSLPFCPLCRSPSFCDIHHLLLACPACSILKGRVKRCESAVPPMTFELREIFRMPGSMNGPNVFISQVVSWVDDPEAVIAKQLHGEGLFFLLVVCFGSKCPFIFIFFCVCVCSPCWDSDCVLRVWMPYFATVCNLAMVYIMVRFY